MGEAFVDAAWRCPICGARTSTPAFRVDTTATEGGVDPERFRPASADFGRTAGEIVRCLACGHGSLREPPHSAAVAQAYEEALDPATIREERGQVATAKRDLEALRAVIGTGPGRLVDVGCWTGSFLVAAVEDGWVAQGIEPSSWAVERARARGVDVRRAALGDDDGLDAGAYRAVICCDVLEHLLDPAAAVARIAALLEQGGVLFATVPDAGSFLARRMGRRWWSVLPMHVQYFTRASLSRLLADHGLEVRSLATHPKLFSRRYYGERVGEFLPVVGPAVARAVARTSGADRLVGPDLRDRIAVVAQKR